MKILRCITMSYSFTTSLNFCHNVARNLHENRYILIRFEVSLFSFWYIATSISTKPLQPEFRGLPLLITCCEEYKIV